MNVDMVKFKLFFYLIVISFWSIFRQISAPKSDTPLTGVFWTDYSFPKSGVKQLLGQKSGKFDDLHRKDQTCLENTSQDIGSCKL